ncbi:hypothetical protein SAMN04487905_109155 [Actinopolyspora xinjiangensis]|uniref:Uncharacterized protein n=1 Tax=Actinopolyspora xinjiangensis TaxID=405564 RepID=A0A1H0VQF5_9ACTN|nr:hypothetical protein SAMN04487905_109155 [Actinopolyspora xinjiangensis]
MFPLATSTRWLRNGSTKRVSATRDCGSGAPRSCTPCDGANARTESPNRHLRATKDTTAPTETKHSPPSTTNQSPAGDASLAPSRGKKDNPTYPPRDSGACGQRRTACRHSLRSHLPTTPRPYRGPGTRPGRPGTRRGSTVAGHEDAARGASVWSYSYGRRFPVERGPVGLPSPVFPTTAQSVPGLYEPAETRIIWISDQRRRGLGTSFLSQAPSSLMRPVEHGHRSTGHREGVEVSASPHLRGAGRPRRARRGGAGVPTPRFEVLGAVLPGRFRAAVVVASAADGPDHTSGNRRNARCRTESHRGPDQGERCEIPPDGTPSGTSTRGFSRRGGGF